MFDGVESPCTQTFGLGLFSEPTAEQLGEIEEFFQAKAAPVLHEVSPLADETLLSLLSERGYRPIELSSVMFREIAAAIDREVNPEISVRLIEPAETEVWARASSAGWSAEMESLADFMFDFGRISASCSGAYPFLAELAGEPVATGMMFVYEDVAMFAGASTIPAARNRGAQNALFNARLRLAAELRCKFAAMAAAPGSQSQINAQKNGFQIAYTRTKWQLKEKKDER